MKTTGVDFGVNANSGHSVDYVVQLFAWIMDDDLIINLMHGALGMEVL